MKLLLEVVVSIVLHPIAMVLAWINIAGRSDLTAGMKIIWDLMCDSFWILHGYQAVEVER